MLPPPGGVIRRDSDGPTWPNFERVGHVASGRKWLAYNHLRLASRGHGQLGQPLRAVGHLTAAIWDLGFRISDFGFHKLPKRS